MLRNWIRKTNRGQWDVETLNKAVDYINQNHSMSFASKLFNIPFSTPQERLKNKNIVKPHLVCKTKRSPSGQQIEVDG